MRAPGTRISWVMCSKTCWRLLIGFIESTVFYYVDSLLAKAHAATLNTCHEPLPSLPLFDNTPPPTYPYTKSLSSYSAVIQLYARSGQLDTALHLSSRLKEGFQPWCRFGCQKIEEPHHIFILCQDSPHSEILIPNDWNLQSSLNAYHPPEQDISFIIKQVSNLFSDSTVWPSVKLMYDGCNIVRRKGLESVYDNWGRRGFSIRPEDWFIWFHDQDRDHM